MQAGAAAGADRGPAARTNITDFAADMDDLSLDSRTLQTSLKIAPKDNCLIAGKPLRSLQANR
jgi:hypothetical protein